MRLGVGIALYFVILGVLGGITAEPKVVSGLAVWVCLGLLPLLKMVVLSRLRLKIPLQLALVTILGILMALFFGLMVVHLLRVAVPNQCLYGP